MSAVRSNALLERPSPTTLAAVLACLAPLVASSTGSDAPRGVYEDRRNGQSYPTVEIGGMVWFARNLNFATHDSYCYGDEPASCATNGRLYRWEAALAACPPGWHISTEYEWQAMELALGVPFAEIGGRRNRGTDQGARLKKGGDTGFDVTYGGWRQEHGDYESLGEAAALWTANEADLDHAWHRDIDTGDDAIWRSRVVKDYALSVRCVRDRWNRDRDREP